MKVGQIYESPSGLYVVLELASSSVRVKIIASTDDVGEECIWYVRECKEDRLITNVEEWKAGALWSLNLETWY